MNIRNHITTIVVAGTLCGFNAQALLAQEQCSAKRIVCEKATAKTTKAMNQVLGLEKRKGKAQSKLDGITGKVEAIRSKFEIKRKKLDSQKAQFEAACKPDDTVTSKACFKLDRVNNRLTKLDDQLKRKEDKINGSQPKLQGKVDRFDNRLSEANTKVTNFTENRDKVCTEAEQCTNES